MKKSKVNPRLRAAVMEVVENQLRNNDPPETKRTFDRLTTAGHTDVEAKRLIGVVVCSEIFDVMKNQQPFDLDRFVRRLDNLPEMPWDDDES